MAPFLSPQPAEPAAGGPVVGGKDHEDIILDPFGDQEVGHLGHAVKLDRNSLQVDTLAQKSQHRAGGDHGEQGRTQQGQRNQQRSQ